MYFRSTWQKCNTTRQGKSPANATWQTSLLRPIRIPCARHCRFRSFSGFDFGLCSDLIWASRRGKIWISSLPSPHPAWRPIQPKNSASLACCRRRSSRQTGRARAPAQRSGERDLQGGVTFTGDRAALYRANLHLRTANRILVRLGDFAAVGFAELRKRAARLPWERCLAPGRAGVVTRHVPQIAPVSF